jgi:hypothetical protein
MILRIIRPEDASGGALSTKSPFYSNAKILGNHLRLSEPATMIPPPQRFALQPGESASAQKFRAS